jgi:hypothetical protein
MGCVGIRQHRAGPARPQLPVLGSRAEARVWRVTGPRGSDNSSSGDDDDDDCVSEVLSNTYLSPVAGAHSVGRLQACVMVMVVSPAAPDWAEADLVVAAPGSELSWGIGLSVGNRASRRSLLPDTRPFAV